MSVLNPLILLPALLGLACGMLVNYLADVLPWKRKLVKPLCIHCQAEMAARNYFFWPRRCLACGKHRDWGVWLVEIIYILIVPWLALNAPQKLGFWGGLLVLVLFGVIAVIDIRYKLILNPVSLVGAVVCFGLGAYLHGPLVSLTGGACGYGIMFAFYKLGELYLKWQGRRRGETIDDEALGFGDVNLSGILGLLLGFPAVIVGLFIGALLGGVFSGLFLLVSVFFRRYKPLTALPYGPWLISGAVVLIFFRSALMRLWG